MIQTKRNLGVVQKLKCFGFVYEHTTGEPDGVTARIWTLNPKIVSHSTCAIISGLCNFVFK